MEDDQKYFYAKFKIDSDFVSGLYSKIYVLTPTLSKLLSASLVNGWSPIWRRQQLQRRNLKSRVRPLRGRQAQIQSISRVD